MSVIGEKISVLLANFKRGNKAFPLAPPPPCNVVLLFKLPVENNKQPNSTTLNERGGGVWIVLFTDIVSTMLSPIVMWYNDMKKTFRKIADVGKQVYIRPVVQQLRDKGKFVIIKIFLISGCLSK